MSEKLGLAAVLDLNLQLWLESSWCNSPIQIFFLVFYCKNFYKKKHIKLSWQCSGAREVMFFFVETHHNTGQVE